MPVQQHLLRGILGQSEGIRQQLLFALELLNAVPVRVYTRRLARIVGRAAGKYEALRLEVGHAARPPRQPSRPSFSLQRQFLPNQALQGTGNHRNGQIS